MSFSLIPTFHSLKLCQAFQSLHLRSLYSVCRNGKVVSCVPGVSSLHTSAIDEAARKGTRARREAVKKANKKKKLAEQERQKNIPLTQKQLLEKFGASLPRQDFSRKPLPPPDDVYIARFFQWKSYSLEEALNNHRETHHPTIFNAPEAPVNLFIELSLSTDKKKRFIETVSGVLPLPHVFDSGSTRKIAALTDDKEEQNRLLEMGCPLVGGKELIKMILEGEINIQQYDYVVASVDIVPQMIPIRQLMKKLFPSAKNGTAVVNVEAAAMRFMSGLKYEAEKNKFDPDYGSLEVMIGHLGMTNQQLGENVKALCESIDYQRGNRKTTDIITKVYMLSPPTNEKFILDHRALLPQADEEKAQATN